MHITKLCLCLYVFAHYGYAVIKKDMKDDCIRLWCVSIPLSVTVQTIGKCIPNAETVLKVRGVGGVLDALKYKKRENNKRECETPVMRPITRTREK